MQTLTADTLSTPDGLRCTCSTGPTSRAARHGADGARPGRTHRPLRLAGRAAERRRLARGGPRPARPRPQRRRARRTARRRRRCFADLALVMDAFRRPGRPGGPHVLLGHSMGGLVAGRFVAEALATARRRGRARSTAWCCRRPRSTPAWAPAQRLLLACWAALAPNLALGNGLQPGWVSRDPAVVQAYIGRPAEPRPHHAAAGALHRRRRCAGARPRAAAGPRTRCCCGPAPTAASRPPAAPPSPPRRRARCCTAQVFPGLFHEIFNEPERAEVVAHLLRWLARF